MLSELGLTREDPLIGLVYDHGIWVKGDVLPGKKQFTAIKGVNLGRNLGLLNFK
jgi:hypothetical protein